MARKTFETEISEFIDAIGLLIRRIRAAAPPSELSLTESAVLARLEKDGPATIADLARAESVKPQSMGAIVATIEGMGFVEREPHPTDGRQMNIQLTVKGLAMRKTIKSAKRTWLAQAVSELDKRQQEELFAATPIIRRLVNGGDEG